MAFAPPAFASVIVIAAVSVVLPWSTWPIVPMLQCGLLRSNFSLAMAKLLWPGSKAEGRFCSVQKSGAGRRDRTDILSLEGCCTTIVLYPREESVAPTSRKSLAFPHPIPFLGFRPLGLETRVVGEEGLEPSKLSQRIYSPPPLPLGTFPQRAFSKP